MDLQTSAQMGGSTATPKQNAGKPAPSGPPPLTPFGAPTAYPDEPVTAGSPVGPGPGPEALAANATPADNEIIVKYLPALQKAATFEGTPQSFKAFVRWLAGQR
jgi:hypothetical protein